MSQPRPVLSERVPGLPPAIDEVERKALAVDPADRYPAAADLARAAKAALDDRTVPASQPTEVRGAPTRLATPPPPPVTPPPVTPPPFTPPPFTPPPFTPPPFSPPPISPPPVTAGRSGGNRGRRNAMFAGGGVLVAGAVAAIVLLASGGSSHKPTRPAAPKPPPQSSTPSQPSNSTPAPASSGSTIDPNTAQQVVLSQLTNPANKFTGVQGATATCPSGVPATGGTSFDCQIAYADGTTGTETVHIDSNGNLSTNPNGGDYTGA